MSRCFKNTHKTETRVVYELSGHLPSRANMRVHWRARHRMARAQRASASIATRAAIGPGRPLYDWYPIRITMTRISPRLLDDDNLTAAFKSIRDGIADALGLTDRDPRITWECQQERGKLPYMRVDIQGKEAE